MITYRYGKIAFLVLLAVQITTAGILRVGDGETYTKIQDAVDAAKAGDIVEITDFAVYEEMVTIDSSKNGLTLRSKNPTGSKKPTIKWKDTEHVLPKTYDQSQHSDSITFDQNGALRIVRVQNVTINGIIVDGGGAAPFGYEGIWNRKDPLFHGNAALALYISGGVVVKNCEFRNAYFGISIKDRNEGGIFANANPADLEPWKVVPLSGFGRTGNHLIEDCKIHSNSWGMFMESVWDMSSTIRYNLIYENHHQTSKIATQVKGMPDGDNQPGGAILLKDVLLTPLAIHNNTFWHNNLEIAGHWQAGGQHLIFNNIFAEPVELYNDADPTVNDNMDIDPVLTNRMHNCLWGVHKKDLETRKQNYNDGVTDPETNQYVAMDTVITGIQRVEVMTGMDRAEAEGQQVILSTTLSDGEVVTRTKMAEWVIQPGARLTTFARGAEVRWYEVKFISTDPESPDFLVPDWDDPLVEKLVLDKGWDEAGVKDADGTIADIGARPKGGRTTTDIVIRAATPVIVDGTTGSVNFDVIGLDKASLKNLKIKYIKWIKGVDYKKDCFGRAIDSISSSDIVTVSADKKVNMGSNSFDFTVPALGSKEIYAFLELILEGENSEGKTEVTTVGFMPYRKVDYSFEVKILDKTKNVELTEVKVGELVRVSVTPIRASDKGTFDDMVKPCTLTLSSGFNMFEESGDTLMIKEVEGTTIKQGYFTIVPNTGYDRITMTGAYNDLIFMGSSKSVKILPGDPAKVSFYDPASGGSATINPGINYKVQLEVADKYGNKVSSGAQVKVKSTAKDIGDMLDGDKPADGKDVTGTTDSLGMVSLFATVTDGDKDEKFPLIATLVANSATDNCTLVVGQAKPRFFIMYSDTDKYDSSIKLRGCAGQKYPVTIIASTKNGDSIVTDLATKFDIDLLSGISAYASEDPADTTRITSSALVKGKKVIWIKSTSGQQINKSIAISSSDGTGVVAGSRDGIYFDLCGPEIEFGAYFADNGNGQVDRLDIWYKKEIEESEIPDSFYLYWSEEISNFLRIVKTEKGKNVVLDKNNAKHLTIKIDPKFAEKITSSSKTKLGTTYWNDPGQPELATMKNAFSIYDSVGPVLTYASVVEKLGTGNDTMFIKISEYVRNEDIKGVTLTLVKKGGKTVDLEVLNVVAIGDSIRVVVKDQGENSPKYGDSLKILASGTIGDRYGNKARPDNRPVPIMVNLVPANIISACYKDKNADGVIDRVEIEFDKNVIKEAIKIECVWDEGNISTKQSLSSTDFSYDTQNEKILKINVDGKFMEGGKPLVRTSGKMRVTVSFNDFGTVKREAEVDDKAAPVIIEATYIPGDYLKSEDKYAIDNLEVKFSEEVSLNSEPIKYPFVHYSKPNGFSKYKIKLKTNPQAIQNGFRYELYDDNGIEGVRYPENGDSIRIDGDLSPILDKKGNYQSNNSNIKRALKVKEVPPELKSVVGPNPFVAGTGRPIVFSVIPKAKMVEKVNTKVTVVIYDRLGNKVFTKSDSSSNQNNDNGSVKIEWDGITLKGRKAGIGTYLAKVISIDLNSPNSKPTKEQYPIGVKKE